MLDKPTHQERIQRRSHGGGTGGQPPPIEPDGEEASCPAFGYLRGIRDQATDVEFRMRNGDRVFFPYAWMGVWVYHPSDGLLLKFSGDLVYLVLIHGSNLDQPLGDGPINLTQAGLQRHRVLWVREMSDEEIRHVGETGPTIESILIAEFESNSALKEWLSKTAPGLLR
jgi:hypothetical protein